MILKNIYRTHDCNELNKKILEKMLVLQDGFSEREVTAGFYLLIYAIITVLRK